MYYNLRAWLNLQRRLLNPERKTMRCLVALWLIFSKKRVPLVAGVSRVRDESHLHLIDVLVGRPKEESRKHLQSLEPRGAQDSVDSASPSISISTRESKGKKRMHRSLAFDVESLYL